MSNLIKSLFGRKPDNAVRPAFAARARLAGLIFGAAYRMGDTANANRTLGPGEDRNDGCRPLVLEIEYVMLHLVSRAALNLAGPDVRDRVLEDVAEMLIQCTAAALAGNCPPDVRNRFREEYYDNLARADADYSACKQVLSHEGTDNLKQVVAWRYATKMVQLTGNDANVLSAAGFEAELRVVLDAMGLSAMIEEAVTESAGA